MNTLGWEAHWITRYDPIGRVLVVQRPHRDGREVLVRADMLNEGEAHATFGGWATVLVPFDEESRYSTLVFPEGAGDAIVAASAELGEGGRAAEIRVLREALDVERARVDQLVDMVAAGARS